MTDPIRNQLPAQREERGFNQFDLSRASRIPQSTISLYENGRRFPGPEAIAAIAGALGVEPTTVYGWLTTPAGPAAPEPASEAETLDMPAMRTSR